MIMHLTRAFFDALEDMTDEENASLVSDIKANYNGKENEDEF